MIILFNRQAMITKEVTEDEFRQFIASMSYAVKKWNDDGRPNSGQI